VSGDLSPFSHIVPCGIDNVAMTSMEKETRAAFSVSDVAMAVGKVALEQIPNLRAAQEVLPANV
jgi:lipoate-protein ligase B